MKSSPRFDYQREVRQNARPLNLLGLFEYYGAGKTYQFIQWIADRIADGHNMLPATVFCPKNIVYQWGQEIQKHSEFSVSVVEGGTRERREAIRTTADIYVCNYDALKTSIKSDLNLLGAKCATVGCDESTKLKNAQTDRSKILNAYFGVLQNKAILTGRPITERTEDLWSQMFFLDRGERLGRTWFGFMKKYFERSSFSEFGWFPRPGALEEIADKIKDICMYVPREKVAAQLPPRQIFPVRFKMKDEVRRQYEELKKNFRLQLNDVAGEVRTKWAVVKTNKLMQMCNGFVYATDEDEERVVGRFDCPKYDWFRDSAHEILAQGPMICWGFHRQTIADICEVLSELKIPHRRFLGGDSQDGVNDFTSGKVDVLVLSQSAAYGGFNLFRAKSAVNFSLGPSGDMRDNALGRNYRIGSEMHDQVIVYDLLVDNSVESVQYEALEGKLNVSDQLLRYLLRD